MKKVSNYTDGERQELFEATGAKRNMSPGVVEKDFWVCWALKMLFEHPVISPNILFKGGTSLSKVYDLIERFSEDVDLILNWELLTDEEPWRERSKTQQDSFNKELNNRAAKYRRVRTGISLLSFSTHSVSSASKSIFAMINTKNSLAIHKSWHYIHLHKFNS